MRKTKNIKAFLETMDHARKYFAICNPSLIDEYNDLSNVYSEERITWVGDCQEELDELKEYRYHCMVLNLLKEKKYKKELFQTYKLKFITHQIGTHIEDDEEIDIIQFEDKFFSIPCYEYDGGYYWSSLKQVKPKQYIKYE